METVRVGGRKYTDPDVISLIKATGSLVDPRSSVLSQARNLLDKLRIFDDIPSEPLKRLTLIASLQGLSIDTMDTDRQRTEKRDAILLTTRSKRIILYNPNRPASRVAFSIAHEISHTFFPNSLTGARFRSICHSSSKEANELERLCDLGASELLMPAADFQRAAAGNYSLQNAEALSSLFGSSYEATVFRLATAHPGIAVSGLLRYRVTVKEQRRATSKEQGLLFGNDPEEVTEVARPKYRRQSVYLSASCGEEFTIRWNKSFDESSSVYTAGTNAGIHFGRQSLPNSSGLTGRLEVIRAPYQREEAHPEFGDVLFFWTPS
jgi:Zn-dependent peptidase ImmA (M78 family)